MKDELTDGPRRNHKQRTNRYENRTHAEHLKPADDDEGTEDQEKDSHAGQNITAVNLSRRFNMLYSHRITQRDCYLEQLECTSEFCMKFRPVFFLHLSFVFGLERH